MNSSGMARRDRERGSLEQRVRDLENQLGGVERWATPIGARLLPRSPAAHAWRTTNQLIANNTLTEVTALTDSSAEYGLELEGGNIIKLRRESTVEYYLVSINLKWSNSSTVGDRQVDIGLRNASDGTWAWLGLDTRAAVTIDDTMVTVCYLVWLNTSDAMKFRVKQTSGGNLNLELCLVDVVMVMSGDVVAP